MKPDISRLMQLNRDIMNTERQIEQFKAERKQSVIDQKAAALKLIELRSELSKGITALEVEQQKGTK